MSAGWFGPRYGALYERDSDPVPTPVGDECIHCGEAIVEGDGGFVNPSAHYECFFRSIVGGVNHQLGRCTCCGGTLPPDPPELSAREAARKAVKLWQRKNPINYQGSRDDPSEP
jgi:hypothetical protein